MLEIPTLGGLAGLIFLQIQILPFVYDKSAVLSPLRHFDSPAAPDS